MKRILYRLHRSWALSYLLYIPAIALAMGLLWLVGAI